MGVAIEEGRQVLKTAIPILAVGEAAAAGLVGGVSAEAADAANDAAATVCDIYDSVEDYNGGFRRRALAEEGGDVGLPSILMDPAELDLRNDLLQDRLVTKMEIYILFQTFPRFGLRLKLSEFEHSQLINRLFATNFVLLK